MFMFNTKGFVEKDIKKRKEKVDVKTKITGCNPNDVIQFYDYKKNKIDDISNKFNVYATCKQSERVDSSGYKVISNSIFKKDNMYKILNGNTNSSLKKFENFCKDTCDNESKCEGFNIYKYEDIYKCGLVEDAQTKTDFILYDGSGSEFRSFEKLDDDAKKIQSTKTNTVVDKCDDTKQSSCYITSPNNIRYGSHLNKQIKVNNNESVVHNKNVDGCTKLCDSNQKCRGFSVYKVDNKKQCEYVIHDYHDFTSNPNNPEMIENKFSVAFDKQSQFID